MFSALAIEEAKKITLPDTDEIEEMTTYDLEMWSRAFDWYNKTFSPDHTFHLSCRGCYDKVYRALKQAQKL